MVYNNSALVNAFLKAQYSARQLAVYRNLHRDPVFAAFTRLVDLINLDRPSDSQLVDAYFDLTHRLLDLSVPGDFRGDAWQYHLLTLILTDANPFSRRAETADLAQLGEGIKKAAASDLRQLQNLAFLGAESFRRIVALRPAETAEGFSPETWPDWTVSGRPGNSPDNGTASLVELANSFLDSADWSEKLPRLAEYYKTNGTGIFAVYRAFRWKKTESGGYLECIANPDPITFDSLFGYQSQRQTVLDNTEKFVRGLPANNILLYGERGTGKSSTVKALLHKFGSRGLRLVEVPKHSLADFPRIIETLSGNSRKFIIFVDDLSFEENDADFTHLKAVLEGSLAAAPPNILVYATSNRRHLVKERFSDREDGTRHDEIRIMDTMHEKLSLADRFGITVTFTSPDQAEYLAIVEGLAQQAGLEVPREELHRLAVQWELRYNGRSGRTARQFVNWLAGEKGLNENIGGNR